MFLAISPEKIPLLIGIIAVLVVHFPLAVIGISKLLKYKNKLLPAWLWHIVVQLLFIVGPIFCILVHNKNSQIRVYKTTVTSEDGTTQEKTVTLVDEKKD